MTDIEFEILDELYFVQPFSYLQQILDYPNDILKESLLQMIQKGWIKCFWANSDNLILPEEMEWESHYQQYSFLATKEGLLAHNSK